MVASRDVRLPRHLIGFGPRVQPPLLLSPQFRTRRFRSSPVHVARAVEASTHSQVLRELALIRTTH